MSGLTAPVPPPEVRRAGSLTWGALVMVTAGTAAAFLLDRDANPIAQGLGFDRGVDHQGEVATDRR